MITRNFNMNSLPKLVPHSPITYKSNNKTCQEHTTKLIEIWQGDMKIQEYCPVCYREQMKEVNE